MSVYVLTDGKHIKIGKANDVSKRKKQLQTGSPLKLTRLYSFPGDRSEEKELQRKLYNYKTSGGSEWFFWNKKVKKMVEDYIMYGSYSGEECLKCNGFLEEKNGPYGKFIGCNNFPTCKYSERRKE